MTMNDLEQRNERRRWWSGVVVSALASINEVNLRRARLVLRWATVSGFNSRCRTLISVFNQPAIAPEANSAFNPYGSANEYQRRLRRQRQVWFIHSVSGWTRGVQVKLWDPLRTRAIPESLRGVFPTIALYKFTFLFTLPWDGSSCISAFQCVVAIHRMQWRH